MYDIIIVGAGPAGLTAALYARRAGKSVLLIEKETFGGQITLSPNVENYPFAKPMSGAALAETLVEQALSSGAQVELDTVIGVEENSDGSLTVITEYSRHEGRTLIIATGLKHRRLGVENEERFIGSGESFCAVCDGAFFRDRTAAVIGGGNTAVQDAIYLSGICSKVYLVHRRREFRAERRVSEGLSACSNIEFVLDSIVTEIVGSGVVEGIRVKNTVTNEEKELKTDAVFVAIGQVPNNTPFAGFVEMDDAGFIIAGESCRTARTNVFVAGDCRTKTVRQLTTAGADGSVAAIAACEYVDLSERTA